MTLTTTNAETREAYVSGLRALADYLTAHPDLPVPRYAYAQGITVCADGDTDDARNSHVDGIARILGTEPARGGISYTAEVSFGPVSYRAIAVKPGNTEGEA
jgi:hypothetical protein